ncbi:MAG: polysaccharide deacetylase family protein [Rhizomicrobium sp.]
MAGGTAMLRGLARWLPPGALRSFGRPVALHFHGVERRIDDPRIQRNHHTLDAFYAIAQALKRDFQVLPLTALAEAIKQPQRHARTVFLMSDDGYRNTLTVAADVLDGLGLPWTLFVSTHHIDTGELNPFTAARLFFTFAPEGRHLIPHLGGAVELGSDATRERACVRGLKRLRMLDIAHARQAIAAMRAAMPSALLASLTERFASERFLNWPQVAELAKRGVEIGAHAHWHWPMHKRRSATEIADEARIPRRRIEHQIGSCRYFAYPFGNVGDVTREAWHAVRDAGYDNAFTTLAGTIDGSTNPWLLPRYELRPRETHLRALAPMLRAGNLRLARWQRRMA